MEASERKVALVVLNAGEATRLRPLTSGTSKAMVRVNGKPVLDYIVESVGIANIQELMLVESERRDALEYARQKYGSQTAVCSVVQREPKGPRDAIAQCVGWLSDGPVVVWFGDTILFDQLPLGETFFATAHVDDQSEFLVWDGDSFYNKPENPTPRGRAFVGVFGASGAALKRALRDTPQHYEVGELILALTERGTPLEVPCVDWHDIGVPARYYETCAALLNKKTRAFNEFSYDSLLNTLTKRARGDEALRTLEAEAHWYSALSGKQALLAPRLVDWDGRGALELSYESGTLLSDLALYQSLPGTFWDYILGRVCSTIDAVFHSEDATLNFKTDFPNLTRTMWTENVSKRLADTSFSPRAREFLMNACWRVETASSPAGGMHGDAHLSNILYEPTTGKLTFVDPRGKYGSYVGVQGSAMYDYCKLGYDCYHGFSALVAGVPNNPLLASALDGALRSLGAPVDIVRDGGIVLLASGVPLHYDSPERQTRMTRVVNEYVEERL